VERASEERPASVLPAPTSPSVGRAGPSGGRAGPSVGGAGAGQFRHVAAVVADDRELLAVVVPFVEEGLAAGDPLIVSCTPRTADLLHRELGSAATAVRADRRVTLAGARAPDIFTHYRQILAGVPGATARLRVIAEVDGLEEPRRRREQQRVEAVANRFLADLPISTVCVYDSRTLPGDVVASAALTHPLLHAGTAVSPSPSYREPAAYLRGLPRPRESVENLPAVLVVEDAPALVDLRHRLTAAIEAHVPDPEQAQDLHLATSEVASNAFRHGRRPVSARLWTDGRLMVCAITDGGSGFDDPTAGFVPAHGFDLGRGGMGLWLARKLWDHVDLLRGPDGLTVRLSTDLR
jgi:anti-sigma regulatory factor (Ser/Thr protein kinase)